MSGLARMDAQEAFLRLALEAMRRPHPDQQAIDAEAAWLLRVSQRPLDSDESSPTPRAPTGMSRCDSRDD